MVKIYKIQLDFIEDCVRVAIGDTYKEVVDYISKEYDVEFQHDPEFTSGFTTELTNKKKKEKHEIILLPKTVKDYVIVHESVHAAWDVLDFHHIEVDANNHEVLAYLTDYIFLNIKKKLDLHGKTKSEDNKEL